MMPALQSVDLADMGRPPAADAAPPRGEVLALERKSPPSENESGAPSRFIVRRREMENPRTHVQHRPVGHPTGDLKSRVGHGAAWVVAMVVDFSPTTQPSAS